MDTTVSITNSRETELQFDVAVEGTDVSDMQVRFVVSANSVDYAFDCRQGDEASKWVVKIPPLPHLKPGAYDFRIEIITNGYFFSPYKGKVNVTPQPVVSQTGGPSKPPAPKVTISQPEPAAKEEEEEISWTAPVMSEEDNKPKADDLLDAFMKNRKERPPMTEQDKAVKAALKDFKTTPIELVPESIKPKPAKKKKVVPKKPIIEQADSPRRSNLTSVIESLDTPNDDQAKKVLDIINSVDKGKE